MVSIDWQLFNVLVVDDDPFQRSIVAKLLGQLGINKVVSADDGHAAAVQLAKNFDLIFLDLNMPGMDGIEFLNVLAAHSSDPGLIFFSGEDVRLLEVAEELARGLSISVLGSVAKPISKENIVQLLEQRASQLTLRQPQVEQKELTEQEVLDGIEAGAISMFYQPEVDTKPLPCAGWR